MPYYLRSSVEKIEKFESLALHTNISYHVILVMRLIHISIYLYLSIALLNKHIRNVRETHSSIEKIKLGWLRQLIWTIALLLAAYILFYILSLKDYCTSSPFNMTGRLFNVWQALLAFFISYKGLIQPDIFTVEENQTAQKYKKSTTQMLNRSQAGEIFF